MILNWPFLTQFQTEKIVWGKKFLKLNIERGKVKSCMIHVVQLTNKFLIINLIIFNIELSRKYLFLPPSVLMFSFQDFAKKISSCVLDVGRLCCCIVGLDIWQQHQKMSPQTNLLRYFLNMSVFISIQQKLYEMSPSSSISALYNLRDKLLTR